METQRIVIKDESKRLVYGEVYAPLQIDTDGEAMTSEEVEKMAHHKRSQAHLPLAVDFEAGDVDFLLPLNARDVKFVSSVDMSYQHLRQ